MLKRVIIPADVVPFHDTFLLSYFDVVVFKTCQRFLSRVDK